MAAGGERWVSNGRYRELFAQLLGQEPPEILDCADETVSRFLSTREILSSKYSSALLFSGLNKARAASTLLCGGAVTETTPLLRASLECLQYSVLIHHDLQAETNYRLRHQSEDARKYVRNVFPRSAKKLICRLDAKLWEEWQKLYDIFIDFGAHPNIASVDPMISFEQVPEGRILNFTQLSNGSERFAFGALAVRLYVVFGRFFTIFWPFEYENEGMGTKLALIESAARDLFRKAL